MSKSKEIIRYKDIVDTHNEYYNKTYDTAHEALYDNAEDSVCIESFGRSFYDLPKVFKASVRVRFMRTDGKVVVRRILATARPIHGELIYDHDGQEVGYEPPSIEFN